MKQEDQDFLLKQIEISRDFLEKFFYFKVNAEVQLLSNQFQYLQSLGGISLAAVSILLGTGSVSFSFLWVMTAIASLALLIYVSTNVRETVDLKAKELRDTEKSLEAKDEELTNVVSEAMRSGNISLYTTFVKENAGQKAANAPMSYDGEISIFLFLLMLLFGGLAAAEEGGCLSGLELLVFFATGLVCCFSISMLDWNRDLTKFISRKLDRILHK